MTVFLNGDFLPAREAKISPGDRGFLFADGVYEALCAYDGRLFLAEEHFARLRRSLRALRLEHALDDLTAARFTEIARELVRQNDLADRNAKIYLQVTRGAPAHRKHAFPTEPTVPTIYATAGAYALPEQQWANGVKVLLTRDERWARCDVKSVSLLPNVLANQEAMEAGAYEAVMIRRAEGGARVVTEGSHSSFAAVVDGTVITHPLGEAVLPSVTRGLVLKLAREEGLPVREEPLSAHHLPGADELFLIGTTTGVMPVTQVERGANVEVPGKEVWTVGDGRPGLVTRQLQDAYDEVTTGGRPVRLDAATFLEAEPA